MKQDVKCYPTKMFAAPVYSYSSCSCDILYIPGIFQKKRYEQKIVAVKTATTQSLFKRGNWHPWIAQQKHGV